MNVTAKLERDPYYSSGKYLEDIFHKINSDNPDTAKKLIDEAKLFDIKYYEGDFPRYTEIVEMYLEIGDLEAAREVLLEAKEKTKDFYQRPYLDLYEINKKLNKWEENVKLLKQVVEENETAFYEYGYQKLIEMLLEKKEYKKALELLEKAKEMQIQTFSEERRKEIDSLDPIKRKEFYPSVEDYKLSLQLKEILSKTKN